MAKQGIVSFWQFQLRANNLANRALITRTHCA